MTARYSIYFTPADDSALARFGNAILGRDASSYKNRKLSDTSDIAPFADAALWETYTEKPAHYGFHATIKAPFELAPDCTAAELLDDLAAYCKHRQPITLQSLQPARLQAFTALAMQQQPEALVELAADVVRHFEPYRQELSAADIQRRQIDTLSPSQIDNLTNYGYPYIFSDFQFHMTLSGAISDDEDRFLPWVKSIYQQLVANSPDLDRLCVFRQVDRQTPFVRIAEFRLGDA